MEFGVSSTISRGGEKMAIDLKKIEITKRTWILLAFLVCAIAGYCYVLFSDEPPPPTPTAVNVGTKAVTSNAGDTKQQAGAIGPVATTGEVKDPFEVPLPYQPVEKRNVAITAPNTSGGDNTSRNNSAGASAPIVTPQLNGTVIGSEGRAAILTLGSESRPVQIGGTIGNYKLVEVNQKSAVVAGPRGNITLWMRR